MAENLTLGMQHDLHRDLVPWTFLPYLFGGFALVMMDVDGADPRSWTTIGMLLLVAGLTSCLVPRVRTPLWGALAHMLFAIVLLLAWLWFPASDVQYILLIPTLSIATILGPWASMAICILAALPLSVLTITAVVTPRGIDAPFPALLVLASSAFLVHVAQRPQRAMLAWAWEGYEQARRHLEQARDRQVELKQALEDLALANSQTIRLNEMLKAAREAVDEARRAKEEFVAKVSHELRTPLNMIIGFSDMILETPHVYSRRLPPALLADVAAIRRNSQHLASLVDDVLDLAEADMGRAHLVLEWTSLGDVVSEAVEAVAVLFEKKGLTLEADVVENLPSIYCDRTRIRQVLLNLLSNAGRFTEAGGARVEARLENGAIAVTVSDTGPGMNPENLNRLFEPFQQGDESTRRRYGGSGLGLAISKRFVEMHGGRIWIESDVGAGTRVSFALPVQQATADDTPRRWFSPYQEYTPRTRQSQAPELRPRPRMVILERGSALRHLVEHYVEGVEAVCASTPRAAAAAAETNAATAVLINAASMDSSPDAAELLSHASLDVPVMTCWVPERRTTITRMGAQDYLVKPIQRSDLFDSIRTTCPKARTILLVDDDPEARQLFSRMLASADEAYTVLQAADGEAALSLLRERKPDLLLLDLVMPRRGGFLVLEAKAADPSIRGIPTIVISAKDPQREPIMSKALVVSRCQGLSARDLMDAVQAVTRVLRPRVDAPAVGGTLVVSWACE